MWRILKAKTSKAHALMRQIGRSLREGGVGATLTLCVRRIVADLSKLGAGKRRDTHPFDLKYGTDTSGIVSPGALDIPDYRAACAV
jgi:hypothetical protein